MKKHIFLIFLLFGIQSFVFADGIKDKMSIGIHLGHWTPGFNKINDGLKELQKVALSQNVAFSGDTEIGGMIDFGASLNYQYNNKVLFRLESFLWTKENKLTLESQGISTDLKYKYTIIPAIFSGFLSFKNESNNFMFYTGGGAGIAFIKSNVPVSFFGEDKNIKNSTNSLMIQLLAGVDYLVIKNISIFAEYRYLFGGFNEKNEILNISNDDNVSLTSSKIMGGINYHF